MYIWKLERPVSGYDETTALVLVAATEADAKQIAHDNARGDQSPDAWFAPDVEINAVGAAALDLPEGTIILTDFREG